MPWKYIGDWKRVTRCIFHNVPAPWMENENPCENGCPGEIDGECPFFEEPLEEYKDLFVREKE